MASFQEITPYQLQENPFQLIDKDWLLITAEQDGKVNTMTASWGGMGILWNKPVAFIFVRKSRYTHTFTEKTDRVSLSVLPSGYRRELGYCGRVSGRNEDKIKACHFTVEHELDTPYIGQARLVFLCKKLYTNEICKAGFEDLNLFEENYDTGDLHTVYVMEIEKVLKAEEE